MKFFFQSEELGLIQWDYAPVHKQAEPGREPGTYQIAHQRNRTQAQSKKF